MRDREKQSFMTVGSVAQNLLFLPEMEISGHFEAKSARKNNHKGYISSFTNSVSYSV
jgi:hypothetical protein